MDIDTVDSVLDPAVAYPALLVPAQDYSVLEEEVVVQKVRHEKKRRRRQYDGELVLLLQDPLITQLMKLFVM